jgi:hypothetical protein
LYGAASGCGKMTGTSLSFDFLYVAYFSAGVHSENILDTMYLMLKINTYNFLSSFVHMFHKIYRRKLFRTCQETSLQAVTTPPPPPKRIHTPPPTKEENICTLRQSEREMNIQSVYKLQVKWQLSLTSVADFPRGNQVECSL